VRSDRPFHRKEKVAPDGALLQDENLRMVAGRENPFEA
jgi:hypothetical protein